MYRKIQRLPGLSLTYGSWISRWAGQSVSALLPSPKSAIEPEVVFLHDCWSMALFGSDRPVMPTFKTPPELDSAARSPYDDLNRIERNGDRNNDRNPERNGDRSPAARQDRGDERELRAQDRQERPLEKAPEQNGRGDDRELERILERAASAQAKAAPQVSRKGIEGTHPLIEGLFSKLPEPETQWGLPARQKWLQTAASIFDLMYAANETDAGELAIRVERPSSR
jgi:hypothetical protein